MEKLIPPSTINVSEELAFLIRGFFSAPVITALSRSGVFEVMLSKSPFTLDDFPTLSNKKLLENIFQYLCRIGLLSAEANHHSWSRTELGTQIFQRAGSFYVPHSYHEYMEALDAQLSGKKTQNPSVDRAENVIGSGKTHLRYFPFATSFLKRRINFEVIADIGCGDGEFLSTVLNAIPNKSVVGVDFSPVSVQMTQENLRQKHPKNEINILCSDALEIENWGEKLKKIAGPKPLAISLWFLIHEISQNNPARVIDFFKHIHALFPSAPVIACEIVRHENEILAAHCKESIMPEYLFFHDMSGQGILSWDEYQHILKNIPYTLESERLFDEIPDAVGNPIPSSFLWFLGPRKVSS